MTPGPEQEEPGQASFEALMDELQGLLARLTDGEAPLEQLVQDHGRAVRLAQRARALLDTAQARLDPA